MPTQIVAALNQVTHIGVEATPGTAVAANKRLTSMGFPLTPGRNVQEFRPRGWKYASAYAQTQVWSMGEIADGSAASYTELQYILASLMSKTTPVQIGSVAWLAATVYRVGDYVRPGTPNGFIYKVTAATGPTAATEPTFPTAAGATVVSGGVTFQQAGANTQLVYDWTFDTSTFSRDDVQTYTVDSGDRQSGRFYRAPYAFFTGMELSSGRGDEVGISGSLVGHKRSIVTPVANPTEKAMLPATPAHLNIYMDPIAVDLGKTQLDGNMTCNFSLTDKQTQVWFHGRQYQGPAGQVESAPDASAELVQADGTEVDDLLAALEAGQRRFFRYEFVGPAIGTTAVNYEIVVDFAAKISDGESLDEEENVWAATLPLGIEHDSTWGRAIRIRVRNGESAL